MRRRVKIVFAIVATALLSGLNGGAALALPQGTHPVQPTKPLSISRMSQGECLAKTLGKIVANLACDGNQACSYYDEKDGKFHLKCVDSLHVPK